MNAENWPAEKNESKLRDGVSTAEKGHHRQEILGSKILRGLIHGAKVSETKLTGEDQRKRLINVFTNHTETRDGGGSE